MVGPPANVMGFSANPSAEFTRLQEELVSPDQVQEPGNAGILGGNDQTKR